MARRWARQQQRRNDLVGVYDVPAIAAAVLVLASVALIAASIPTLRIARIDPATTLREE